MRRATISFCFFKFQLCTSASWSVFKMLPTHDITSLRWQHRYLEYFGLLPTPRWPSLSVFISMIHTSHHKLRHLWPYIWMTSRFNHCLIWIRWKSFSLKPPIFKCKSTISLSKEIYFLKATILVEFDRAQGKTNIWLVIMCTYLCIYDHMKAIILKSFISC